jgi:hypothetical protein
MSWNESHSLSERLASEGDALFRAGDMPGAASKYREAAEHEETALLSLDQSKTRTWGITAISASALWFKGREFRKAEKLALAALSRDDLPIFASNELELIVQTIWTERMARGAGVPFLPGQVTVSIEGGQVVRGGAPLDLVLTRVQTIQALFFRTIELIQDLPHRVSTVPRDVQEMFRPWLLQAPPGSYQFSIAIQEPSQPDFFKKGIAPEEVADRFLRVVKASGEQDLEELTRLVPDTAYRSSFLKLTRNLAPTGKSFSKMEIRTPMSPRSVVLLPEDRSSINKTLRALVPRREDEKDQEIQYRGILRGVHLDKDWLEMTVDGQSVHVSGLRDTIDDVIGPMVNHPVIVRAIKRPKGYPLFVDIEADE